MKPSERIRQIMAEETTKYKEQYKVMMVDYSKFLPSAILKYLDETHVE